MPNDRVPDPGTVFLADEQSQLLALADALASGEAAMIADAFDIVVKTRGIDSLAAAGGLDRLRLRQAISCLGTDDQLLLTALVGCLLRGA